MMNGALTLRAMFEYSQGLFPNKDYCVPHVSRRI